MTRSPESAVDVAVRYLSWPADQPRLERIDTSFITDVVYELQRTSRTFALVERTVAPPLRKEYRVPWEDLPGNTETIVAERAGSLVGVAGLRYVEWNRRAIIAHLYVDRAARGQGIGTRLVQSLHDQAQASLARELWVETQNVNAPAVRFYERCGFVLSGIDTSLYDPRDISGETALFFALSLGEASRGSAS
jgi:GNAT superfamily N-acetyltransferase